MCVCHEKVTPSWIVDDDDATNVDENVYVTANVQSQLMYTLAS